MYSKDIVLCFYKFCLLTKIVVFSQSLYLSILNVYLLHIPNIRSKYIEESNKIFLSLWSSVVALLV